MIQLDTINYLTLPNFCEMIELLIFIEATLPFWIVFSNFLVPTDPFSGFWNAHFGLDGILLLCGNVFLSVLGIFLSLIVLTTILLSFCFYFSFFSRWICHLPFAVEHWRGSTARLKSMIIKGVDVWKTRKNRKPMRLVYYYLLIQQS